MRSSEVSWQLSARLHQLSWLLHARVVEAKLRKLQRAVKANFDPNQPRVPAGNPDGGQWTSTGGGSSASSGTQNASPGTLTSIPEERPASARIRHVIIKELAKEAAILAVGGAGDGAVGLLLTTMNVASWVHDYGPFIQSYIDPPKSLEELQDAVPTPARGYDIHHIVEQAPAEQDGFPRSLINSRDNLVRIPTLKHWQINSWYQTLNDDFGGLSPRGYLRGKTWEERSKVGRDVLIEQGILKP